jgi:S-adenosylmethionine-diacylglycerol 3-amino-3-carboxypropyl transferase
MRDDMMRDDVMRDGVGALRPPGSPRPGHRSNRFSQLSKRTMQAALSSLDPTTEKTDPPGDARGGPPDPDGLRYAQCWEDADVLVEGLDVQPGDTCLSIASAGDNALALLTQDPARVVAIDVSAAQLACLALRVAAYRRLEHGELLELIGSRHSTRRAALYDRCRAAMDAEPRRFWDAHPALIERGIGAVGRFERYFRLFRRWVLPWIQSDETVRRLLAGGPPEERRRFYDDEWDHWRWRGAFRAFFSRFVMSRLGREPEYFEHVEGRVADRLLDRARYALTALDPADNPYLQWILTGRHRTARPRALRREHFETIRHRLDRLTWAHVSLEDYLEQQAPNTIDRFNLSDVFEYVDEEAYHRMLDHLVRVGRPGGRLAYWNLFVPRSRPASMTDRLVPRAQRANALHARDRAFFYGDFVLEDVAT